MINEEIDPITPVEPASPPDPAPPASAAPTPPAASPDALRTLQEELATANSRICALENERVLLSLGVPEEDLDYYAFKIEKRAGAEGDFRSAAKAFLKEVPPRSRLHPASTGASLSGRTPKAESASDVMNRLLRTAVSA